MGITTTWFSDLCDTSQQNLQLCINVLSWAAHGATAAALLQSSLLFLSARQLTCVSANCPCRCNLFLPQNIQFCGTILASEVLQSLMLFSLRIPLLIISLHAHFLMFRANTYLKTLFLFLCACRVHLPP